MAPWDGAGTTAPSSVAAPSHGAVRWPHQWPVRRQKKEKAKTKDNYQLQRRWILDQVQDDRGGEGEDDGRREVLAGLRHRATERTIVNAVFNEPP